jgi:hypothetical protein
MYINRGGLSMLGRLSEPTGCVRAQ